MAKQYSEKDIKTMDPIIHMRTHPGMYDFDIHSQKGQFQFFKEVLDNSLDEVKMTPNKHHIVDITFLKGKKNYQVIIRDMGRGVPLKKLKDSFSKPGTSGKWSDSYSASTGTYGMGSKATAALSNTFTAISQRRDGTAIYTMEKGVSKQFVIDNKLKVDKTNTGTIVVWEPDNTILSGLDKFFDEDGGYLLVHNLLEFVGVFMKNVTFNIYFSKGVIKHNEFIGKPNVILNRLFGLKREIVFESNVTLTPVEYLRKVNNIHSSITWQSPVFEKLKDPSNDADKFGYALEVFTTADLGKKNSSFITAVNGTMMRLNTAAQVEGTHAVFKKLLSQFVVDQDQRDFFLSVYKLPIHAVIMAEYQNATFIGQGKNNFTDRTFRSMFVNHLENNVKRLGIEFLQALFDLVEIDIIEKFNRYNNKGFNSTLDGKNLAFKLNNPDCFNDCESNDSSITEIFFTEGDSAGGYVKQWRNSATQAVLKVGGKPINPFKVDQTRFRADKLCQDIVKILGVSPADLDLSNMRFARIGLLADADSHGYHITSLLLAILHKINPLIISSGRVFMANPPLYILQYGKRNIPIRDETAMMDTRIEVYEQCLSIDIESNNGSKYTTSGANYRSLIYAIKHIGNIIDAVAKKVIIDPLLIEQLSFCIDYIDIPNKKVQINKIAKVLGADNCTYDSTNNIIILSVEGLDIIVPLEDLIPELKAYVIPELRVFSPDKISIKISSIMSDTYIDQSVSIYQLFSILENVDSFYGITKLKGLGELTPEQLMTTCLDPTTRSYKNITSTGDIDRMYAILGNSTKVRKQMIQKELGSIT